MGGAGGFVGSWLLARLSCKLPADAEIMASGRHVSGATARALDITNTFEVDALVRGFRPTCVVHLAAISSLDQARLGAREAWIVNLFGTMNLAEAVMRHAPDARFIFAGSSEIYGGSFNAACGIVDETVLPHPRNVYAATKASADLMLGQMADAGLRVVRFRPFNHTGPGQSTCFVVPAFASQIAAIERSERPPVMKVGNLDAKRDFLDVRDVVDAYILALLAPELPNGAIFNLASGIPRKIGDVLENLLTMSRATIRVEQDETLMRPSDVPITAGDARRANAILGWRPAIAWDTTLNDVLNSYRREPNG
jgi:GDP-4-dehydro-6-deoxy-D-mannose reductase